MLELKRRAHFWTKYRSKSHTEQVCSSYQFESEIYREIYVTSIHLVQTADVAV